MENAVCSKQENMAGVELIMQEPRLVYVPPVNAATRKWGVYAIPMMWRLPDQSLVIRFNGEQDMASTADMQQAENLYFQSEDQGKTWKWVENGDRKFDISVLTGIASPYLFCRDGRVMAVRAKMDCAPIQNVPYRKEFVLPNQEAVVHSYRYGEIPEDSKGIELLEYQGETCQCQEITLDFPEREVLVNCASLSPGQEGADKFLAEEEKLCPFIFKRPYFSSLTELDHGVLAALSCGQHPEVDDHYCGVVYLVVSEDGGKSWRKRGTVASDPTMKYGYGGDGTEVTLTRASNGDLLCVMRMDMSLGYQDGSITGTMLAVSHDQGYTWETPRLMSDESVTPHVVALKDGLVLMIYGRPGVHCRYSEDNGKTWSEPHSMIGPTLKQAMAEGRDYLDVKYGNTCSYSNTYVERISEDTVLALYNDIQYDPGDGCRHKAAFVREITLRRM